MSLARRIFAFHRNGRRKPWRFGRAVYELILWNDSSNVALGCAGVALAAASMAFAIRMIVIRHDPLIRDIEYLAIFAQPNSAALRRPQEPPPAARAEARSSPLIDYTFTGSIEKPAQSAPSGPLKAGKSDYEILGATEQAAWLRIGVDILEARKGQVIPGIGKIVAIERHAGAWRLIVDDGSSASRESPLRAPRPGATTRLKRKLIFGDDKR